VVDSGEPLAELAELTSAASWSAVTRMRRCFRRRGVLFVNPGRSDARATARRATRCSLWN